MNVSVTKVKATTSTMGLVMYAAYGRGDGQKTKTDRNDGTAEGLVDTRVASQVWSTKGC